MDRIRLSTADIEYILKWRDEHQDLVRSAPCPIKAVKIECIETGFIITSIREKNTLTCIVNHKGLSMGKIMFKLIAFGRWTMTANKTNLDSDNIQSILTVYGSTMAFLVYGNSDTDAPMPDEPLPDTPLPDTPENKADRPEKKKTGKKPTKKKDSITYILHRGKTTSLRPTGARSKISCEFSVRGHFRHYKSGKVVWIAEYQKGTGKKRNHIYKVGNKPE